MGFLDKALKTATDLTNQAGAKLAEQGVAVPGTSAGEATKLYQELGQLVHAEHRGETVDPARRTELLTRLDALAEQAADAPAPEPTVTEQPPPPPPPAV